MAAKIDHTTIREGGPPPDATKATSLRWWLENTEGAAAAITGTLEAMKTDQAARLLQQTIACRLYGNVSLVGRNAIAGLKPSGQTALLRDQISYNAVQSAIDTVTSKIAKNKPKPLFLTSGGDYKMQRKAKQLNRFVEGVFYENEAYRLGVECFRDAAVVGDGVIHVYAESGRVKFERVLSAELWVDEVDGFYGAPRQMHRVKRIDRAVLLDLVAAWASSGKWDKARTEDALRAVRDTAGELDDTPRGGRPYVADLVQVRESWHLPDGPDATKADPKNGKHVISVDGAVLFEEPYIHPCFPFARFRWTPRLFGFWSQGGAEQVQNLQLEINKLLWTIQRSFHLGGSFKVFIERGSKIIKEHLRNEIGGVIEYTGTAPSYAVPPMVPPEVFAHLLTLKNAVYEQLGVSQLSATAQKPAGLNSGKALREYNDIESDRFMTIGQEYERFFVDLARLAIQVVKDLAGERGSYKVRAPDRFKIAELDWKDVRLKEDAYVLQAFPISSLPNEPAGRQQTIQEYVQAGWITPRQGKRLMDFPDLEAHEGLANAAEDYASYVLEQIVDEGIYTPPEPFDDLNLMFELALEYYQRGKYQQLEEERLEMLRRFLLQIQEIRDMTAPQPAPAATLPPGAQGEAGAVPQALPMGPPPSDLLPFGGAGPNVGQPQPAPALA